MSQLFLEEVEKIQLGSLINRVVFGSSIMEDFPEDRYREGFFWTLASLTPTGWCPGEDGPLLWEAGGFPRLTLLPAFPLSENRAAGTMPSFTTRWQGRPPSTSSPLHSKEIASTADHPGMWSLRKINSENACDCLHWGRLWVRLLRDKPSRFPGRKGKGNYESGLWRGVK